MTYPGAGPAAIAFSEWIMRVFLKKKYAAYSDDEVRVFAARGRYGAQAELERRGNQRQSMERAARNAARKEFDQSRKEDLDRQERQEFERVKAEELERLKRQRGG